MSSNPISEHPNASHSLSSSLSKPHLLKTHFIIAFFSDVPLPEMYFLRVEGGITIRLQPRSQRTLRTQPPISPSECACCDTLNA